MSDKKTVSNAVCIDRLRELIDAKSSRQEIASDPIMDCDVSLITKHYNGDRVITIDFLKKYCEYFKVSADYLLGLSDSVLSPDNPIRFINDYTGLCDDAIDCLHQMYSADSSSESLTVLEIYDEYFKFVNFLLADEDFALFRASQYIHYYTDCNMMQNLALGNDQTTKIKPSERLLAIADDSYVRLRLYYYEAVDAYKKALEEYVSDRESIAKKKQKVVEDYFNQAIHQESLALDRSTDNED